MATVNNVRLKIKKGGSGPRRKVTINYTLRFTRGEVAAGAVYSEKITLRGDDPVFDDHQATLATRYVKATSPTRVRKYEHMAKRTWLDEDGDTIIGGVVISRDRDEVYARVELVPVKPIGGKGDSNVVTGQFGPGASD